MRGPSRPDRARTDCTRQGGRGSMRLTVLHALRALVALLVVTLGLFLGPASWASTLKVNCAQGGNLQAKMASASPGATVLGKGTCRGNFVVSGTGITLEGKPSASLDGMDLG